MKITGPATAVILTEEGKRVLHLASIGLPDSNFLLVDVAESEDLGLWIRVLRDQALHYFLLRWETSWGSTWRQNPEKLWA